MGSPTSPDQPRPFIGRYHSVIVCDLPTVFDMARHLPNRGHRIARIATAFGILTASALTLAAPMGAAAESAPATVAVPAVPTVESAVPAADGAVPAESDPAAVTASYRTAQRKVEATRATAQAKSLHVRHVRSRVVEVARKQLGDTYAAGGTGPNRFDCSGLTRYVFRVATGKNLPHQSHAQYGRVRHISKAKAQPGDLVFFFRNGAHHVGIYIGKGHMIDARGYGKGVRVSPISGSWWGQSFSGIGRLLPAA